MSDALAILTARLQAQHASIDALDSKLAAFFGFSVGLVALFLGALGTEERLEDWQWLALGAALALLSVQAVLTGLAYVPKSTASFPAPAHILDYLPHPNAREAWARNLADAIEECKDSVKFKAMMLRLVAAGFVALTGIVFTGAVRGLV